MVTPLLPYFPSSVLPVLLLDPEGFPLCLHGILEEVGLLLPSEYANAVWGGREENE